MHFGMFLLYGLFITAEIAVLALMRSTGNLYGLFPAALWMLVDLMVAAAGLIVSMDPGYRAVIMPRLLLFHTLAFGAALVWMGIDAARDAHPLAAIFFWGFVMMAVSRAFQFLLERTLDRPLPWVLLVQSASVALLTAYLIASLLLPIPPQPVTPTYRAPMLGDPAPAGAAAMIEVQR